MHGKSFLNICLWLENTLGLDGYQEISGEKNSCRPRSCDCCYRFKWRSRQWHCTPGEDFTKSLLFKQLGDLIRNHRALPWILSMISLLKRSLVGQETSAVKPSSIREIITDALAQKSSGWCRSESTTGCRCGCTSWCWEPEFYVKMTHKFMSKDAYAKVRGVTCFSYILGTVWGVNCKIMCLVHLRAWGRRRGAGAAYFTEICLQRHSNTFLCLW